jgi:hypothetical protein
MTAMTAMTAIDGVSDLSRGNGTYLGGSIFNVGWIRHAVCAVIHRTCRQALIKKGLVLFRNAWWITQKTLIHPTIRLK